MTALAAKERAAPATALAQPLVELRNVTKVFRQGPHEAAALRGVSLTIRQGEFVALTGPSGSGKSILRNIVGGLEEPSSGIVRLGAARGRAGFVARHDDLLEWASVAKNVEIAAAYAGVPREQRVAAAREILASLGLDEHAHERPSALSRPERQRVAIARALIGGGDLLVADEPTGELDSRGSREILGILQDLHERGCTVILFTHDPVVAQKAGRIMRLLDGRIVADSGPTTARRRWPAVATGEQAPPRAVAPALPDLAEPAKAAMHWLRARPLRTILALLPIALGVGLLVAMTAAGSAPVLDPAPPGGGTFVVRPGSPDYRQAGPLTATLAAADAEAIADLPNIASAIPESPTQATVQHGDQALASTVDATVPTFLAARRWPMAQGIFFDEADVRTYAPVTALGASVARSLFEPGTDPIGQYILVNGVPLQVIGVMAPTGTGANGADADNVVLVPLTTASLRLFGQSSVKSISVQASDIGGLYAAERAVRQLLLDRHRTLDYQIAVPQAAAQAAAPEPAPLGSVLGPAGGVALLAGGIGVMQMMFAGVAERRREIAIRRAMGARGRDLLLQFALPAVLLCAIGGLIGAAAGAVAACEISYPAAPEGLATSIALALAGALAVGVAFAYPPARQAARLHPAAALGE